MIVKKLIEVEKVCCEICGEEIVFGKDYSSGMFASLHTFFNWSASDIVPQPIEVTPLCLCAKCQEKYAREIAVELFETYKVKITEIKLRRK